MKILGDNTIEKKVMAVVKSKITSAQKEYEDQCTRMEEQTQEAHKKLDEKLESDKEQVAKKLVDQICGKFI